MCNFIIFLLYMYVVLHIWMLIFFSFLHWIVVLIPLNKQCHVPFYDMVYLSMLFNAASLSCYLAGILPIRRKIQNNQSVLFYTMHFYDLSYHSFLCCLTMSFPILDLFCCSVLCCVMLHLSIPCHATPFYFAYPYLL